MKEALKNVSLYATAQVFQSPVMKTSEGENQLLAKIGFLQQNSAFLP